MRQAPEREQLMHAVGDEAEEPGLVAPMPVVAEPHAGAVHQVEAGDEDRPQVAHSEDEPPRQIGFDGASPAMEIGIFGAPYPATGTELRQNPRDEMILIEGVALGRR